MNKGKAKRVAARINKMGFSSRVENDPVFINGVSKGFFAVAVSAESGDDAADYYGEFRGGYPWINPKLEAVAKSNNGYFEWRNPGEIVFYED